MRTSGISWPRTIPRRDPQDFSTLPFSCIAHQPRVHFTLFSSRCCSHTNTTNKPKSVYQSYLAAILRHTIRVDRIDTMRWRALWVR